MSTAKDVSTFPLVTSLGDDDALISAKGKRIKVENVSKAGNSMTFTLTAGEDRWVRVADMNGYGSSCIFAISAARINQGYIIPLTMLISAPHGGASGNILIKPLSLEKVNTANARYLFTKIRVSSMEARKYVDLWMTNITADVAVTVVIACPLYTTLVTPTENAAPLTHIKEFEVDSSLWGG